jgi:hypothetical protein
MWLAHASVAAVIVVGLGMVVTAVVAIVKIRAERSPEQVRAESQAALAKKVPDKKAAMLLTTLDALARNNKADIPALQEGLLQLLQEPDSSRTDEPEELPSSAQPSDECPDAPDGPGSKISDDQLRKFVDEQPDSNADILTAVAA